MIVAKTRLKNIPKSCLKCKFCEDTDTIGSKAGCEENHWIADSYRKYKCFLSGMEVPYIYDKVKHKWEYIKCKSCPLREA